MSSPVKKSPSHDDATISADTLDVLQDQEDIELDEVEDGVMEDEEMDLGESYEQLNIEEMPAFLETEDGSLQAMPSVCSQDNSGPASMTESEDELQEAYRKLEARVSVLSQNRPSSPHGMQPPSPPSHIKEKVPAAATCSSPATGRGQRGRGRKQGGRAGRSAKEKSDWKRGQSFSERFVSDEDLPPQLREDFRRLSASRRNTRSRKPGAGVFNQDVTEDDVVEHWCFDFDEEFVWRPSNEFQGEREKFVPQECGPTSLITNAYDALHSIWDDEIMSHIVARSNENAETITNASFQRRWFPTNISEIWCLFAFWMMLGIMKMPSIKSCFSKMPLLKTEVFRFLFTETRYWNLNKAFRLSNGSDTSNPLHAMGPVIDHLNKKFKEMYRMEQDVCIDESLTLWKGPLGIKQYIKTKSARWGIKSFQLCESKTGYLWAFFVYSGRNDADALPASVSAVFKLIRPILNMGYTLFMDNWFNSPTLARWLKRRRTDCVGTLRASRKHVPLEVVHCPLAEGQFVARSSENVIVVAVHDKKRITCLSTYHDMTQVCKIQTQQSWKPQQYKLQLIADYNQGMGGVDLMDQKLDAYLIERKQCVQWTRKLFKRLLNVSIQNARVIVEKSTNRRLDSLAFRLALVEQIINKHYSSCPRPPTSVINARHSAFPMSRLKERHFIRRIPVTQEMRDKTPHRFVGRNRCVWCRVNRRDRKTVYECEQCELPLCLEDCFKAFHTQP